MTALIAWLLKFILPDTFSKWIELVSILAGFCFTAGIGAVGMNHWNAGEVQTAKHAVEVIRDNHVAFVARVNSEGQKQTINTLTVEKEHATKINEITADFNRHLAELRKSGSMQHFPTENGSNNSSTLPKASSCEQETGNPEFQPRRTGGNDAPTFCQVNHEFCIKVLEDTDKIDACAKIIQETGHPLIDEPN